MKWSKFYTVSKVLSEFLKIEFCLPLESDLIVSIFYFVLKLNLDFSR